MIGCGYAQVFAWFVDLEKSKAEFNLVCLALKKRTVDLYKVWCAVLYQLQQWMARKEHSCRTDYIFQKILDFPVDIV